MKRFGGLWPQIVCFENLLSAHRRARRGKRNRPDVAAFELRLESNLLQLETELSQGEYRTGEYRLFTVYERKPRLIAAAPYRDRVVHHAVMNVLEPLLDKTFIFDTYACRVGKGAHRAVARYQGWAQRYAYVLKMDIQQYFPSIDRRILCQKLAHRIKDYPLLTLLRDIIDSAPQANTVLQYFSGDDLLTPLFRPLGMPIGNLLSQCFANLYLDDLDHFVKQTLGVKAYLRYVDDMVVMANSKAQLADWREAVRERLVLDRLTLHPRKTNISPTASGLSLLGYTVFPHLRRVRGDNVRRFVRRLKKYARAYHQNRMVWSDFDPSVQSWLGHARHADATALCDRVFDTIIFSKATDH